MAAAEPLAPLQAGVHDGLSWLLAAPSGGARAGVVILHGAGSAKESHLDFARACAAGGLAALAFDARGHGASAGALDGRAAQDVASMAGVLRERAGVERVGLRGSSMGGYLALVSAAGAQAGAVVAICPAAARLLAAGIASGRHGFRADAAAVAAFLQANDEVEAIRRATAPILLQHAEDDEVVPVAHSRVLHAAAPAGRSTLVVVPGGDHRSVQHDPARQAEAVAFLRRGLG